MKKYLFILLLAVLLAPLQQVGAQNLYWGKQFQGSNNNYGRSVVVDASGNLYTAGYYSGTTDFDPNAGTFDLTTAGGRNHTYVTKLTADGVLLWAKQFESATDNFGYSAAVDASGNVYVTGYFQGTADFNPGTGTFNLTSASSLFGDVFIVKLDASGNFVWAKQIGGVLTDQGWSVIADATGNTYTTGLFRDTVDFDPGAGIFNLISFGDNDIFVTKLDAAGNFVWAKQMGGASIDQGADVALDLSGNLYLSGFFYSTADFDPGAGNFTLTSKGFNDAFIAKLDTAGNFVWAKQMGSPSNENATSIALDVSGNVYSTGRFRDVCDFDPGAGTFNLTAAGSDDIFISKLDNAGNLIWVKQIGGSGTDNGYAIAVDASSNVYVTGGFRSTVDFDPGAGTFNLVADNNKPDIFIAKLNAAGDLVWAQQYGDTVFAFDECFSIAADAFGNIYATGYFGGTADFDPGPGILNFTAANQDVFILKLFESASYVEGNVYGDLNTNCNFDSSDAVLRWTLVKVEPNSLYGLTDSLGNYKIYLPQAGNYSVSLAAPDIIWQPSCNTAIQNIQLATAPATVSGIDFVMQATDYCPRLIVDISTPILRQCINNVYSVSYRNTGSSVVSNAYIEINFSNYLQPQGSTLPWMAVSGNTYTFLIGNLGLNQSGTFKLTAFLDCNAEMGSTQCVTAHIYPDSICITPPAGWDKSETKVTGGCVNDSLVCFMIKNRSQLGTGDMNGAAQWRLYVNDTLVTQGTYQLAGQDSLVKCYPANGKTYRLEADQNPPHPGNSHPKAIIEACGNPSVFGFVNTVPQDDADFFVETSCMEVRASHDPNDKQVSPAGITTNHFITADDELEYMIRFQNTGNDTAFKVVIRDTIATGVLDIATLTSGASSHSYTFNIYGQGIAEWTFDNILLPDSNINEPESNGFIQFKIKQLPGNANGTRIENSAAIYFDYNLPVITNTAWSEVNEGNMPESFFSASTHNVACPDTTTGATASVTASGGVLPYRYQWNNGASTAAVSNLSQGNYSVTVSDAAGTVFTDTVSVIEPLLASISTQGSVTCFGGDDAAVKVNVTGGVPSYAVQWSDGQDDFTANNLSAGNYAVTVTDSNNCQLVTSIAIQDGYQVNTGAITGADTADINQTATTYNVHAGLSYAWNVTNGTIISGQGTNSVEVDWSAIGQGTLLVIATDQGCADTVLKTITLIDPTGIQDVFNDFELYPNPTTGTITVKAGSSGLLQYAPATLKLYDAVGKEVVKQTAEPAMFQQGVTLDLGNVHAGVFYLCIKTDSGTRVIKVLKY